MTEKVRPYLLSIVNLKIKNFSIRDFCKKNWFLINIFVFWQNMFFLTNFLQKCVFFLTKMFFFIFGQKMYFLIKMFFFFLTKMCFLSFSLTKKCFFCQKMFFFYFWQILQFLNQYFYVWLNFKILTKKVNFWPRFRIFKNFFWKSKISR